MGRFISCVWKNFKGGKDMKKKSHTLWRVLGNIVCSVAVFSVYVGHPHCLLIIHQPKVPEELKEFERENINDNINL